MTKQYLKDNNVIVMKWPTQSSALNSIEMLWIDVERDFEKKKPKNLTDLMEFFKRLEIISPLTVVFALWSPCRVDVQKLLSKWVWRQSISSML